MMPMPIPLRTRKPGHQHIRTERRITLTMSASAPSCPPHFPKVSSALFENQSRPRAKNVPALRNTRPPPATLPSAALPARPTNCCQLYSAALAAIQRHQQHTRAPPTRFQRQHSAIFIIGMRHGLHQPRSRAQPPQHEPQAESAPILRKLGRRSLIGQLRKIRYRGLLIVSNWRRNACTPELSPVRCGEATSKTGNTTSISKNDVVVNEAFEEGRKRRSKRLARWLGPEYFTLQGWALTPLGRKFFPHMDPTFK